MTEFEKVIWKATMVIVCCMVLLIGLFVYSNITREEIKLTDYSCGEINEGIISDKCIASAKIYFGADYCYDITKLYFYYDLHCNEEG